MSKTNPFAFGDMNDLPDELKKKATTSRPSYAKQDAVLDMIKGHPGEYTNAEVRVAWFRTHGDVMKETTMRSYLNGLVKRGLLIKPTTQSYSIPVAGAAVVAETAPAAPEAEVVTPELVAKAEAEQPVEAPVVEEAPVAKAAPEAPVEASAEPVAEEAEPAVVETAAGDVDLAEVDNVLAELDLNV